MNGLVILLNLLLIGGMAEDKASPWLAKVLGRTAPVETGLATAVQRHVESFFQKMREPIWPEAPMTVEEVAPAAPKARKPKTKKSSSESIGHPSRGRLVNGVRLVTDARGMGNGFVMNPERRMQYATAETVKAVKACMRDYRRHFPKRKKHPPVSIGDLSPRKGGPAPPHVSHESGRDVDIGYLTQPPQSPGRFDRTANRSNLDREKQWVLTKCFLDNPDTQAIFIHHNVVESLREYIRKIYKGKRAYLARKYLAFFPGGATPILRPDREHGSHMHVRFECPKGDRQCVE